MPLGIGIGLTVGVIALLRGDVAQAALGGFIIALWVPTSRRITCRIDDLTRDRSPRAAAEPPPRDPQPR